MDKEQLIKSMTMYSSKQNAKPPKYYNEITILKAFAALFITWFHFKWFVPDALSPFFIGGAIGNSIFFFCSGYLLSFKDERYPGQWLVKKYFRIMIAVWVTLCLLTAFSYFRFGFFYSFPVLEWLYPEQFWFVRAILIYFLVSYIAYKIYSIFRKGGGIPEKKWFVCLFVLAIIIHFAFYFFFVEKNSLVMDEGGVKTWFFWFVFFLLGFYKKSYGGIVKYSWLSILEAFGAIALFFVYKRIAIHYMPLVYLQFLFIPLLLLYIVLAWRRIAYYLLSLKMPDFLKKIIIVISDMTLEIYLVQWFFIQWIMPSFSFPLNLAVSLAVIFLLAYITHFIADRISSIKNVV